MSEGKPGRAPEAETPTQSLPAQNGSAGDRPSTGRPAEGVPAPRYGLKGERQDTTSRPAGARPGATSRTIGTQPGTGSQSSGSSNGASSRPFDPPATPRPRGGEVASSARSRDQEVSDARSAAAARHAHSAKTREEGGTTPGGPAGSRSNRSTASTGSGATSVPGQRPGGQQRAPGSDETAGAADGLFRTESPARDQAAVQTGASARTDASEAPTEPAAPTMSFTRGLLERVRGWNKRDGDGAGNATDAQPVESAGAAQTAETDGPAEPVSSQTATRSPGWRERLGLPPKAREPQPVDVPQTGPGVPTAAAAAAAAVAVSKGQQPAAMSAAPSAPTTVPGDTTRTATGTISPTDRPATYRSPLTPVTPANPFAPAKGPDTAVIPAVGAGAVAPAAPAAAATTQPLVSAKPKVGAPRRTRKARLRLSRLDPWSVMKTSLLFSIAAGIVFVVAAYGVWTVLNASGLFASIDDIVKSVVSTPGDTTPFRVQEYINTQKVMGVATSIAVIDVLIFTALATLGSFLYNLAATVLGGLEVTLAED